MAALRLVRFPLQLKPRKNEWHLWRLALCSVLLHCPAAIYLYICYLFTVSPPFFPLSFRNLALFTFFASWVSSLHCNAAAMCTETQCSPFTVILSTMSIYPLLRTSISSILLLQLAYFVCFLRIQLLSTKFPDWFNIST
jgi:hypothetical protein